MNPQQQDPTNVNPAQTVVGAPVGVSQNPILAEIVSNIQKVSNILVTVPANPSIDQLAAAMALTIGLDKIGKHSTAVFGGQIPNVMSFLKPEETFENNVHSLRDFIISLNKDKADKLRFAKDGEIVKIYVTPYKSSIGPEDLSYSEGDFNVEMVIAVGVANKDELDQVIAAHGRILHDAVVATLMAGGSNPSKLGSLNWVGSDQGSYSAMAADLIAGFDPAGLDPRIATTLLTGLVSDTDRFSNAKTTPLVMSLASKLMQAGADHQLVTANITSVVTNSNPTEGLTATVNPANQPSANLSLAEDKLAGEQSQDNLNLGGAQTATQTSTAASALPTPTIAGAPQELELNLHTVENVVAENAAEKSPTEELSQTAGQSLNNPVSADLATNPQTTATNYQPMSTSTVSQPDITQPSPQAVAQPSVTAPAASTQNLEPAPAAVAANSNLVAEPLAPSAAPIASAAPSLNPTPNTAVGTPQPLNPNPTSVVEEVSVPAAPKEASSIDNIKAELDGLFEEESPQPRADLNAVPVTPIDETITQTTPTDLSLAEEKDTKPSEQLQPTPAVPVSGGFAAPVTQSADKIESLIESSGQVMPDASVQQAQSMPVPQTVEEVVDAGILGGGAEQSIEDLLPPPPPPPPMPDLENPFENKVSFGPGTPQPPSSTQT